MICNKTGKTKTVDGHKLYEVYFTNQERKTCF